MKKATKFDAPRQQRRQRALDRLKARPPTMTLGEDPKAFAARAARAAAELTTLESRLQRQA